MPGRIEIFGIGILSWVTWLPAIGAILLLFFNRSRNKSIRWFANMWIGLCFLVSVPLVTGLGGRGHGYDTAYGGVEFIEEPHWVPLVRARYQLGGDGLSLGLFVSTTM